MFQALKLREGDKDCLAARSKCYLRLGDTESSLKDAEASLQNDKTFSKVTSMKREEATEHSEGLGASVGHTQVAPRTAPPVLLLPEKWRCLVSN